VFWIVATYARCSRILAADGPPAGRATADQRFRAAVGDLLGLHGTADVLDRRDRACALLPAIWAAAGAIVEAGRATGS
jgi:hypothetical protein